MDKQKLLIVIIIIILSSSRTFFLQVRLIIDSVLERVPWEDLQILWSHVSASGYLLGS